MSTEKASLTLPPDTTLSLAAPARQGWRWLRFFRSPLWLCLLLALLLRVWLLVHSNGVIAGDEAMVGLQAEHILHGEHPVYYYGQPYMGSLEAYFAAALFAIFGASVWTLRAVSILLSLFLTFLTWRLAGALADTTRMPAYARRRFMLIAALVAALPPVYDTVQEMRMMGGYVEAYVIMAWLLLCGLRLTQRWQVGVSGRELALRWAGIGFLMGLGMWVDPLVVPAIMAIAIWISVYCLLTFWKLSFRTLDAAKPGYLSLLKGLLLAVTAIPAFAVGFAPAIAWGIKYQWQNISYIFSHGADVGGSRLTTILHIQGAYNSCIAPRIIGGALPTQPDVGFGTPHLLTFGLVVGTFCIAASVVAIGLSIFWHRPFLVNIRQLTGYPLLFAICCAFTFSISAVSIRALEVPCGPWDLVGRYATPLFIALPFFVSAIFTVASVFAQERGNRRDGQNGQPQTMDNEEPDTRTQSIRSATRSPFTTIMLAGLLVVLVAYFATQGFAYFTANAGYTFQTSACTIAPANNDPVIAYMQKEHLTYAWSHGWMGDPIAFKTDGGIITADARFLTGYQPYLGRIPAYTLAVAHADRPSLLALVKHGDANPPQLQLLAQWGVTYRTASFSSEPGFDVMVITPLNRSLTPTEANQITASIFRAYC